MGCVPFFPVTKPVNPGLWLSRREGSDPYSQAKELGEL